MENGNTERAQSNTLKTKLEEIMIRGASQEVSQDKSRRR